MQTSRSSQRALVLGVGLLVSTGVFVVACGVAWKRGFLHDDALITLRYAQNWLAGNGVAWNPGDRVEGYTNFLQLLLATGLAAAGLDLVQALRAIGVAAWLGTVVAVARGAARVARRAGRAEPGQALGPGGAGALWLLPAVATAACLPAITWVFGGLEAPIVACALSVGGIALHAALGSPADADAAVPLRVAGIAFGLALLARLDTGLFAAAAVVFLATSRPAAGRVRALARFGLPLLLLVLPWLVWKTVYYGHPLPNTWWVKGADPTLWRLEAGLRYLVAFALVPPFPLLWLAAGAVRALRTRRGSRGDACLVCAISLHLAWVVYVGGDQMPAWRLALPVAPLSTWLAFALWQPDLARLGARSRAWLFVGAALLVLLQLAWPGVAGPTRNATAFVGARVGEFIREAWRPGALVALNTAGSTPYHAPGLRYLDMLGLNDAHIARRPFGGVRIAGQRLPGHAKGDGAYVLDQQPDYIILGPAEGSDAGQPWFLSGLEIGEDPRFAEDYVRRSATLDVRGHAGFDEHEATRRGAFVFTWYERRR